MLLIEAARTDSVESVIDTVQRAIELEFATLPPYLYAYYTAGQNPAATSRILDIVHEEMIHMMLACNLKNALGQKPSIAANVPKYPGPLPYCIGSDDGHEFDVHLLPFSSPAMDQACTIEEPTHPRDVPVRPEALAATGGQEYQTIGEFYDALRSNLPTDGWSADNQIDDTTAFFGQLFPIASQADAVRAIDRIVSQGEGTDAGTEWSPLDFQGEVAHFYRFSEIGKDRVLQKADNPLGYEYGDPLGIDFGRAIKAIPNPGEHPFADGSPAAKCQETCDRVFTELVDELELAVTGKPDHLGNAVRKMFDLTQAANVALGTPLDSDPDLVAGPAFRYRPELRAGG